MRRMKMMKKNWEKLSLFLIPLAAIIVGLAVWGPEALARYRDKSILNQIQAQGPLAAVCGEAVRVYGIHRQNLPEPCRHYSPLGG